MCSSDLLALSGTGQVSITGAAAERAAVGGLPWGACLAAVTAVLLATLAHGVRPGPAREVGAGLIGPAWLWWVLVVDVSVLDASRRGDLAALVGLLLSLVAGAEAARRRRGASAPWGAVEFGLLQASVTLAVASLGPLSSDGAGTFALALLLTGLALAWYAAMPARIPLAYLAALAVAAAEWVIAADRGVAIVEVYTLPFAALLLAVGSSHLLLAHREGRRPPGSMLVLGPGIGVGIVPSLFVGLGEGDALRVAATTLAAIGLLVVGVAARLQAPVGYGAFALVLTAIVRGGPLLAAVPAWITLLLAGAVILTLAIGWETAVVGGRRAGVWFGQLR